MPYNSFAMTSTFMKLINFKFFSERWLFIMFIIKVSVVVGVVLDSIILKALKKIKFLHIK